MLRTMLLNRPGLMLLILFLPIPEAAAGPIFTHPFESAGTGSWIKGTTSIDSLIGSATGLSGHVPGVSRWVNVQPGRLSSVLGSDPGGFPPWQGRAQAPGNTAGRIPPGAAAAPAGTDAIAVRTTIAAPASSSPAPSVGNLSGSSQPSTPFVPDAAAPRVTAVAGQAVDGSSNAGRPTPSSGQGVAGGSPPASSGVLVASGSASGTSSYQASSTGLGDSRANPSTGATISSVPASQSPAILATGGAMIPSTGPSSSGPSSSSGGGIPIAQGTAAPTTQLNTGGTPPAMPIAANVTTPSTASAATVPQAAGAASPISATSAAMLAAAASAIPGAGSSSQGPTTPVTSSAGGIDPQGLSGVGSSTAGAAIPGSATPSVVTVSQGPSSTDSPGGTTAQLGPVNAVGLVPIAPSPLGTATNPGLPVASSQQLDSAIGAFDERLGQSRRVGCSPRADSSERNHSTAGDTDQPVDRRESRHRWDRESGRSQGAAAEPPRAGGPHALRRRLPGLGDEDDRPPPIPTGVRRSGATVAG